MHAVGNVFGPPFFFDAAAFIGLSMEPIESRGEPLLASGMSEEIPCELLGQKAIVGLIVLEGADDVKRS